jgi:hypothetical protein
MRLIVSPEVIPLQNFATGVLAEIVRRQPPSPARTKFAWEIAVGPGLARSTTIDLQGGVVTVRARDQRWALEVDRALPTILARLQHLLGVTTVTRIDIARGWDQD